MDEFFTVYCTRPLYGIGKLLVITASQYESNGKEFTAEIYLFACDGPGGYRYKGKRFIYNLDPESHPEMVNVEFVEIEVKQSAISIILLTQHKEYLKTADRNFIDFPVELIICDKEELDVLKDNGFYEDRLVYIAATTKSQQLKAYLDMTLHIPRIHVEED